MSLLICNVTFINVESKVNITKIFISIAVVSLLAPKALK